MFYLFAGGLHQCPLCPGRTKHLLRRVISHFGAPASVALEWDEEFASQLRDARPMLETRLLETWEAHEPSPELLATLGSALAWESDLAKLAPKAQTIWLQHGCTGEVEHSVQYWHNRFAAWIGDPVLVAHAKPALRQICVRAHAIADGASRTWNYEFGNDEKWLETLDHYVDPAADGWSLVVLGSLHTTLADHRTLWRYFTEQGRPCRRLYACLPPPHAWG